MSMTQMRTRNKDIVRILELTLEACSGFAVWQKSWGVDYIYFKTAQEKNYHSTQKHFADELLECVYSLIQKKSDGQGLDEMPTGITFEVTDESRTKAECIVCRTDITSVEYVGLSSVHEEQLRILLQAAEGSFLEPDVITALREKVQDFFSERQKVSQCQNPFPQYTVMERYLQSYYQLLTFLMLNDQMQDGLGSGMLQSLLQMDCYDDALSLLSPMAMNQLRKMYLGIEQYYNKLLNQKDDNAVMELFYKSVISQKVKQSFRWFFNGMNGDLMHAAVDAYAGEQTKLDLKVGCRGIRQYNSYEGIGELRIAEKILYEMERYLGTRSDAVSSGVFRVAVLGDIGQKPMEELWTYLNGALYQRKTGKGLKFLFNVFSKNFAADVPQYEDGDVVICYHNDLDAVFMDRELMCRVLHEHEVIFMMDCVKLYSPVDYSPESDLDYLKQRFIFGNALKNATEDNIDICSLNLFDKLYELMTVYERSGRLGRFSKKANDTLLKFCEDHITGDFVTGYHTLYAYVSDLTAFDNIYCNDQYYMRTERYNQKEIGIIRYTSGKGEQMDFPVSPDPDQGKMLCFNIWQIVKHISLEKRADIIKEMLCMTRCPDIDGQVINDYDLHTMYVGIDYSDWPKKLSLHYAVVADDSHEIRTDDWIVNRFLEEFVRGIIVPMFDDGREELFQQYFWKAIYSLLYGDAKNVEEMLLIHLLWNKPEKMGDVCIADINNPEQVRDNINWDNKYSIKRFIAMIISKFDISASNSMDQVWTEYIINKNEIVMSGNQRLFREVGMACEGIGYTDSYLYRNCRDM